MGNGKPGKCSLKAKEIKAYVGMTNCEFFPVPQEGLQPRIAELGVL